MNDDEKYLEILKNFILGSGTLAIGLMYIYCLRSWIERSLILIITALAMGISYKKYLFSIDNIIYYLTIAIGPIIGVIVI